MICIFFHLVLLDHIFELININAFQPCTWHFNFFARYFLIFPFLCIQFLNIFIIFTSLKDYLQFTAWAAKSKFVKMAFTSIMFIINRDILQIHVVKAIQLEQNGMPNLIIGAPHRISINQLEMLVDRHSSSF